jgi:hypothetical protein
MERVRNSIFAVKTTLSEEELRKYIL